MKRWKTVEHFMTDLVGLYGIKACDTMKKARLWLDAHDIPFVFHDYKKEGVRSEKLRARIAVVGWEKLINRAGTTFRKLPEELKAQLDEARAIELMIAQPSMIRRPVLEAGELLIGFRPDEYALFFQKKS